MIDITKLYDEKKCIIVGKSSYSYDNNIDTSFLKDFITFGLNTACLEYDCNLTVVLDAWLFPDVVKQIRPKTSYLAIQNLWIENLNISHLADILFTKTGEFTLKFENKLYYRRTVALAAVHLAIFMGFKEILLFNVDFGPTYAPVFNKKIKYGHKDNKPEFSKRESNIINSLFNTMAYHYNVKIYQANPKAITPLPIINYLDFCNKELCHA